MRNKILIGVVVFAALIIVAQLLSAVKFGKTVNTLTQQFMSGVIIGSETDASCIKMMDSDKGGWSYQTVLNGTLTTTGGTEGSGFTIPTACVGK